MSRATVPGPPSLGDGARLSVSPAPSPRRRQMSGRDGGSAVGIAQSHRTVEAHTPSVIGTVPGKTTAELSIHKELMALWLKLSRNESHAVPPTRPTAGLQWSR